MYISSLVETHFDTMSTESRSWVTPACTRSLSTPFQAIMIPLSVQRCGGGTASE